MPMKISVDMERCTGHGRCYTLAPEVFAPDEHGYSEVVVSHREVPPDFEDQTRMAAANCPERAIEMSE